MSGLNKAASVFRNYPVTKKRTALWFFTQEIKNKTSNSAPDNQSTQTPDGQTNTKALKRLQIYGLWHRMDPEAKRKYFNMAELDEVRFKEQHSLWIAQVGSLIAKQSDGVEGGNNTLPALKKILTDSTEKYRAYERMIQTESTVSIYKSIVDSINKGGHDLSPDELISAIPSKYRPILKKPRRPQTSFILFTNHNRERLMKLRQEKYPSYSILRVSSMEWGRLDEKEREKYYQEYSRLSDVYNKLMKEFKTSDRNSDIEYLEQAMKEKKAFKKSLRKQLRKSTFVPINVRNAFNFFLMENRNIPITKLSAIWRDLPPEKKQIYIDKHRQDVERYQMEKLEYDNVTKRLSFDDMRLKPVTSEG